jgi:hypothetical protein
LGIGGRTACVANTLWIQDIHHFDDGIPKAWNCRCEILHHFIKFSKFFFLILFPEWLYPAVVKTKNIERKKCRANDLMRLAIVRPSMAGHTHCRNRFVSFHIQCSGWPAIAKLIEKIKVDLRRSWLSTKELHSHSGKRVFRGSRALCRNGLC